MNSKDMKPVIFEFSSIREIAMEDAFKEAIKLFREKQKDMQNISVTCLKGLVFQNGIKWTFAFYRQVVTYTEDKTFTIDRR